jgi:signal peptidase I
VVIPAEGMTIDLTPENWIFYKRVITAYEYNEVEEKADGIYINGTKVEKYTFKQNYYWMMGDNRHGSVDSRYWGFVGEDHIVGTASFVWMSKHPEKGWFSGGLRWDRVFSFVE